MYNRCITELKSDFTQTIINCAVRTWVKKNLAHDTICDKINKLQIRLDRASKKEFIKIYKITCFREC